MKFIALLIFGLAFSACVKGQDCHCPEGSRMTGDKIPLRIFSFNNKSDVGVCGLSEARGSDTVYSEFCVYECGKDVILGEWGALNECKIRKTGDTLIVDELYRLPIGDTFSYLSTPFYGHKFFYENGVIVEHTFYYKNIRKYSQQEIKQVKQQYKKLSKGNHEQTTHVALMLFWCYVSGDKQAEIYLNNIEKKFGPFDGAVSEWWTEIIATYKQWKKKTYNK